MDPAQLVDSIRVVELTAKTRDAAIRALARSALAAEDGLAIDDVIKAVEERESTALTIVAEGLAMPHALLDWEGDLRVVLGRSRAGIDYGLSETAPVKLIALFIVSKRYPHLHLEVLAALAELLGDGEFRRSLAEAPNTAAITRHLRHQAGVAAASRSRRAIVPRLSTLLARGAVQLAELLSAQAVLVAIDEPAAIPWSALTEWRGRLLLVTPRHGIDTDSPPVAAQSRPDDTHWIDVPHGSLSRLDRANLGLLLAASSGLLSDQARVVCLTGPGGRELDSVTVARPDAQLHTMFGGKTSRRVTTTKPAVILRVLSLALELAAEGREAQPVGAAFVIGDTPHVLSQSRQLVLNPFHGFSRRLRSVLDPSLAETIKEFALIDGAFIIDAGGTVVSAGAYLAPKKASPPLPPGLGTRHQAAAAITASTEAMAITVSQSTGAVTVFRNGAILLKLEQTPQSRS